MTLPFFGIPRIDLAYNISILVFLFGLFISGASGDWMALSRAGALIVMISILLIFKSLGQWSQKDLVYRHWMQNPIFIKAMSDEDGLDYDEISKRLEARNNEIMNNLKEDDSIAQHVWLHEKVLLLIGTFIWGFGDLFPKIIGILPNA